MDLNEPLTIDTGFYFWIEKTSGLINVEGKWVSTSANIKKLKYKEAKKTARLGCMRTKTKP